MFLPPFTVNGAEQCVVIVFRAMPWRVDRYADIFVPAVARKLSFNLLGGAQPRRVAVEV